MKEWDYKVRGYSSAKHRCGRFGILLLETVHKGKSSKDIEVEVWRDRAKERKDVAYIQVIDLKTGETETISF